MLMDFGSFKFTLISVEYYALALDLALIKTAFGEG